MTEHFSPDFVDRLVAASAGRPPVAGSSGVIGLGVGKKVLATVEIVEGRATGAVEGEPDVTIPFSGTQVDAWLAGTLNLSQAYMRGDLKPVGATGPLTAALELLDDPDVVAELG